MSVLSLRTSVHAKASPSLAVLVAEAGAVMLGVYTRRQLLPKDPVSTRAERDLLYAIQESQTLHLRFCIRGGMHAKQGSFEHIQKIRVPLLNLRTFGSQILPVALVNKIARAIANNETIVVAG